MSIMNNSNDIIEGEDLFLSTLYSIYAKINRAQSWYNKNKWWKKFFTRHPNCEVLSSFKDPSVIYKMKTSVIPSEFLVDSIDSKCVGSLKRMESIAEHKHAGKRGQLRTVKNISVGSMRAYNRNICNSIDTDIDFNMPYKDKNTEFSNKEKYLRRKAKE